MQATMNEGATEIVGRVLGFPHCNFCGQDKLHHTFGQFENELLSRLGRLLASQPHLMAPSTEAAESSTSHSLPGQSPPLAALTQTDRSGIVVIATSLCLVFGLFSMAIRISVRQYFRRAQLAWDDVASITSMVGCPRSPRPESQTDQSGE